MLAEKIEGQLECFAENREKCINFSVQIEKELEHCEREFRINFLDSVRFMTSSISSFAGNLAEELHNSKCKDSKSCIEYIKAKNKLLIFECLKCNKNHKKYFIRPIIRFIQI